MNSIYENYLISALFKLNSADMTPAKLSLCVNHDYHLHTTPEGIGKYLASLNVPQERKRVNKVLGRYLVWDPEIQDRLQRRFKENEQSNEV